jgi:hypothetical protein
MSKIIKYESNTFSEEEKTELFNMYSQTYLGAGETLWFKTSTELFERYPCLLSYEDQYLKFYVMFQFKTKANKISLICHNGVKENKDRLMDLL